jgi:hypothetical protein
MLYVIIAICNDHYNGSTINLIYAYLASNVDSSCINRTDVCVQDHFDDVSITSLISDDAALPMNVKTCLQ